MLLSLAVFAYPAFPPLLISAFLRRDRWMSLANNRRAGMSGKGTAEDVPSKPIPFTDPVLAASMAPP
jgi:hypothetical protein